jgi:hypothetical protein
MMIDVQKITEQYKSDLKGTFFRIKNMRQKDKDRIRFFLFEK